MDRITARTAKHKKRISKAHLPHLMRAAALKLGLASLVLCSSCSREEGLHISLTSHSPDGRHRAEIVEITGRLDRNFFVRLTDLQSGTSTNIFHSPDEGLPPTERIVWARDTSRLLILGRELFVDEQGRMPDGQQLYLLYDLNSGVLKCNASQQDRYETFNRADLTGIDWTDQIEQ